MEYQEKYKLKKLDEFKKQYPNDTNVTIRDGSKFIIVSDQRSVEC